MSFRKRRHIAAKNSAVEKDMMHKLARMSLEQRDKQRRDAVKCLEIGGWVAACARNKICALNIVARHDDWL
jgi:hypothetical protein